MKSIFLTAMLLMVMVQHATYAQTGKKYNSIHQAMQQPDSVVWFSMANMGLTVVPDELRYFKNLRYLDLSFNSIEVLPDFLSAFNQLVYADFSHNPIKHLPKDFTGLVSLRNLYMSFRDARDFEANAVQFTHLCSLKVLHLKAPGLTEWPQALSTLQQLQYLLLEDTQLGQLPLSVTGLKRLQYISIGNSTNFDLAESIPVLSQLPELKELHLSDDHRLQIFHFTGRNLSTVYRHHNSSNLYLKQEESNSRQTHIYMNPELFMAPGGTESDSPLK